MYQYYLNNRCCLFLPHSCYERLKILEDSVRAAQQPAARHANDHARFAAAQEGVENEGRVEQDLCRIRDAAGFKDRRQHQHDEGRQVRFLQRAYKYIFYL